MTNNKQHHFVVMYDEADNTFTIDWDTYPTAFPDGNVWNPETDAWESDAVGENAERNRDVQEWADAILNGWLQRINETLETEEETPPC